MVSLKRNDNWEVNNIYLHLRKIISFFFWFLVLRWEAEIANIIALCLTQSGIKSTILTSLKYNVDTYYMHAL